MGAEPATTMTAEETVRDYTNQPEIEEEEKVEVAEGNQELKVIPENEEEGERRHVTDNYKRT